MLAPLDQFQIFPLVIFKIFWLDASLTNFFFVNVLTLVIFRSFMFYSSFIIRYGSRASAFFISNAWQKVFELAPELIAQLVADIILINAAMYFSLLLVLLYVILLSNLIGLIPYSFTSTSHLTVTFFLALSVFIGINIITVLKYRLKSFSAFLPDSTSFFLALLLAPIEFISYIAKPISLGVRLFINLMAGHSLLKVIVGFAWGMLVLQNPKSFGLLFPILILIILFGLEFGVALIQTYVFLVLTCIYINDGN